jgi:hypothetical protein
MTSLSLSTRPSSPLSGPPQSPPHFYLTPFLLSSSARHATKPRPARAGRYVRHDVLDAAAAAVFAAGAWRSPAAGGAGGDEVRVCAGWLEEGGFGLPRGGGRLPAGDVARLFEGTWAAVRGRVCPDIEVRAPGQGGRERGGGRDLACARGGVNFSSGGSSLSGGSWLAE